MASRRVRFTTTAGLVNELLEARDDRTLSKVVARYARVELLILDELACAPRGAVTPGGMRGPPSAAAAAGRS